MKAVVRYSLKKKNIKILNVVIPTLQPKEKKAVISTCGWRMWKRC